MSQAYQQAGVNIRAGDEAVERIKIHARSTHRPEVIGGLGGFGGLFALNVQKYRNPILVSGTDGVGTKLKLAFEMDHHETVGIDLVAMCVNDILVSGAEPLYFLDYIACEKLEPEKIENIVETNIRSEGLIKGVIQVTADGFPIIMLSDHGTIGGYPKIGVVISADYDKLVQLTPGSRVKFQEVDLNSAETLFKLYDLETQSLISKI